MKGNCALCTKQTELQESHIIPKFVFNWLKDSTPGAIRSNQSPNVRVQDGLKKDLLCQECEQLFSSWEKIFCERIFLPLHKNPSTKTAYHYSSWALKFAVSVSWRVLTYFQQLHDLSHFSDSQRETALQALRTWREFLLGELPNPAQFEQHLLPVDAIERYSGPKISPFLNRYFLRSVHANVICSTKTALVYTKMGHLIIFGFIDVPSSKNWRGTKLHVNNGIIMPRNYKLPQNIADYMNDAANESGETLASISSKQKQVIKKAILDNADEYVNSEVFRAMRYDVYHSGKNAFKITE